MHSSPALLVLSSGGVMNIEYGEWEGVIYCVSHQFCLVKRSQHSRPTLLQGHIMQPLGHLPHPPPLHSPFFWPPPSLPHPHQLPAPSVWLLSKSLIDLSLYRGRPSDVSSLSSDLPSVKAWCVRRGSRSFSPPWGHSLPSAWWRWR